MLPIIEEIAMGKTQKNKSMTKNKYYGTDVKVLPFATNKRMSIEEIIQSNIEVIRDDLLHAKNLSQDKVSRILNNCQIVLSFIPNEDVKVQFGLDYDTDVVQDENESIGTKLTWFYYDKDKKNGSQSTCHKTTRLLSDIDYDEAERMVISDIAKISNIKTALSFVRSGIVLLDIRNGHRQYSWNNAVVFEDTMSVVEK